MGEVRGAKTRFGADCGGARCKHWTDDLLYMAVADACGRVSWMFGGKGVGMQYEYPVAARSGLWVVDPIIS